MALPVITTVRNTPLDGLHLDVTLASAPTGTPHFFFSRLPGAAGEVTVLPATAMPASGTTTVTSGFAEPRTARQLALSGSQSTCLGNVSVTGIDPNGLIITETVALNGVGRVVTDNYFLLVTQVIIPHRGAAGDTVTIISTGTEVLATSGAGTAWRIKVTDAAKRVREGFYVVCTDDAGDSNEEAEWCCFGSALDIKNQIEQALHDLVADNRKLLDRSLQLFLQSINWPNGNTAKTEGVLRGYPIEQDMDRFPTVSIRIHDLQEDPWFANDYTDNIPVSGTIYVYMFHQGQGQPAEPIVSALAMGVFNVLNQFNSLQIVLDCGLVCTKSMCDNIHTDQEFVSQKSGYMAIAEMAWSCHLFMGKDP